MFYDNFINYCNNVNKSPSAVASELGLSRASVNGWKHGKIPTDANQIRIANYFGISVSELMAKQKEKADESQLDNLYFNFAKEAQENKIDPDDIREAIDMIRKLRGKK